MPKLMENVCKSLSIWAKICKTGTKHLRIFVLLLCRHNEIDTVIWYANRKLPQRIEPSGIDFSGSQDDSLLDMTRFVLLQKLLDKESYSALVGALHTTRAPIWRIKPYPPLPGVEQAVLFFGVVSSCLDNFISCHATGRIAVDSTHDLSRCLNVF